MFGSHEQLTNLTQPEENAAPTTVDDPAERPS
jgi:hypothetical protein